MRNSLVTAVQSLVLLSLAMLAERGTVVVSAPIEAVVITLHPVAQYKSAVVRLADVAEITGGDAALRARIAAFDLEDTPLSGDSLEITPPQVEFRLRLAGIEMDRVAIRGPAVQVSSPAGERGGVSPPARLSQNRGANATPLAWARSNKAEATSVSPQEQAVLDAAKKCILARLPWPADDVSLRLVQPLRREVRQFDQADEVTCSAEVRSPGTPVGRVSVRVVLTASGRQTLDVPVVFDVRHFDSVVVAAKPIQRGQLISKSDLYVDRQEVTALVGYSSTSENLIGTKAKRTIGAVQMVRQADVEAAGRPSEPFLVKRRDRVKLIGRTELLLVTAVGEALQDGRVGEVIKVRNVDSNATVHGRVLNASEVEVTQ